MPAERMVVARIGAPHGVRGEVRLTAFTDDPMAPAAYRHLATADGRAVEILALRAAKNALIARLKGVGDRDAAEALRGTELWLERAALPAPGEEDAFYQADLIGLDVLTEDGTALGRVVAVHDFGAGDLLEIAPDGARSGTLLPFTKAFVPRVEIAAGRLVAAPPHGLFEPDGPPPESGEGDDPR